MLRKTNASSSMLRQMTRSANAFAPMLREMIKYATVASAFVLLITHFPPIYELLSLVVNPTDAWELVLVCHDYVALATIALTASTVILLILSAQQRKSHALDQRRYDKLEADYSVLLADYVHVHGQLEDANLGLGQSHYATSECA